MPLTARRPVMPKVGIAIPAFQAADTLRATLDSCIAQTCRDWIAYVTVDGTTATREQAIVRELDDPRVSVECNGRQVGQFGNFNRAVLRCYAAGVEWVKMLCADDVLRPDALERMLGVADGDVRCGLVYGYYDGIDERGEPLWGVDLASTRSRIVGGEEFLERAFSQALFNPIGGPSSVMIRREVIERCGVFDDRLNYSGEAALWYRILSRFDIAVVGEEPVLAYRFHGNSITGRGQLGAARFEQPIDIAREIASHYAPFSLPWRRAQAMVGEVVGANLLTSIALARRRDFASAVTSALVSLRRLSPYSAPYAIRSFGGRLARLALGLPQVRPREWAPRTTPLLRESSSVPPSG